MKKIICISIICLLSVLLFACGKKAVDTAQTTSDKVTFETNPTIQNSSVFVRNAEEDKNYQINYNDNKTVRKLISKADFKVNPLDNISDIVFTVDEKQYSYDSENGIFTYSDENTEINKELTAQLSDLDRETINNIIIKYTTLYAAPNSGVVHNDFLVKEISNTSLTMSRYDKSSMQELKEGLFCGDYGTLENASTLNLKVGDVITVYYDENIMECYPYQIIIRKIVCD